MAPRSRAGVSFPVFGHGFAAERRPSRQLLRGRELGDRGRGQADLRLIGGARGVPVQLRRDLFERLLPRLSRQLLRARQLRPRCPDPGGGKPIRSLELIEIRSRLREAGRPDELPLLLRVQIVEAYRLRGVELVLRDETAWEQLEQIESARDL